LIKAQIFSVDDDVNFGDIIAVRVRISFDVGATIGEIYREELVEQLEVSVVVVLLGITKSTSGMDKRERGRAKREIDDPSHVKVSSGNVDTTSGVNPDLVFVSIVRLSLGLPIEILYVDGGELLQFELRLVLDGFFKTCKTAILDEVDDSVMFAVLSENGQVTSRGDDHVTSDGQNNIFTYNKGGSIRDDESSAEIQIRV